MCQKGRNAGKRLQASSPLMGKRSGLGGQSQSQELHPRGFAVEKFWASPQKGPDHVVPC